MKDKKKDDPSSTSQAYDIMAPRWQKINALLGGTEAMRAAGQAYLPQHGNEKDVVYAERLASTTLLNMTELTLESWVGRPFSEPIILGEDVPAPIVELMEDVDLQGHNLQVFARSWFRDGLAKCFSHVMVEFPRPIAKPEGQPRTLADDRKENLRPYWVHIPPENIIFAHTEMVNGVETLTQVRIQEVVVTIDGFAEVITPRIRVITPGEVKIYEYKKAKGGKVQWVLVESYTYDLPFIPLVTFYAAREAPFLGKPPLTDLADLNISHWQSSSDQRAVLTVARFPILACSGGKDDEKIVLGPNKWLFNPDPQGKFYYVEHTGAAIGAGREDMKALEEQMSQYGAEFLKKRPGDATATARALDSAEATSPLQDVTVRFEDALNTALAYTAQWLKLGQEGGKVTVNKEFGPEEINTADLDTLNKARDRRDISRSAYIDELQRRGVIDEEYDPEEDVEELNEETAKMVQTMTDLDPGAPQPGAGGEGGGAGGV